MPYPTPKVYIAFDDGPYVVSPTWTDVTSYVLNATVDRGREDDYGQFVGTATVTFNNNGGQFNPFNTSGTYYGKLLPNRQIKIEGIANSTTYGVFCGYVAGWPMQFNESGYAATVTIQCFDALSLLAQEQIDPVPSDSYILSLSPTMFYKFNEAITTGAYVTIKDYSGNGLDLTSSSPSGAARYPTNTGSLADGIPYQALNFNNNVATSRSSGTTSGYGTMSVCFWYVNQFNSAGSVSHNALFAYGTGTIVVGLDSSSRVQATVTTAFGTGFIRYTDAVWNWNTGEPHHICVTFTSGSGTCTIYVDGVAMSTSSGGSGFSGTTFYSVGAGNDIFQQVAVFPTALSATQVANIYAFSANRYPETTTVRANRVVDRTSFPAGLRNFTASPAGTVSEGGTGTMSVATELQKISYSEGGNLYVNKTGALTLTNRTANITDSTATTPQATFIDTGAALKYGNPVEISYDADDIINAVTIDYTGAANLTATNSTSITAYGRKAATWDTYNAAYTDAANLATTYLTYGNIARPKLSPIQAGVNTAAADWQTLLGLELLYRVKFTMTPKTGSTFTQNGIVQKLQHRITPERWDLAVTASGRYAAFFVLDYSALDGPDVLY